MPHQSVVVDLALENIPPNIRDDMAWMHGSFSRLVGLVIRCQHDESGYTETISEEMDMHCPRMKYGDDTDCDLNTALDRNERVHVLSTVLFYTQQTSLLKEIFDEDTLRQLEQSEAVVVRDHPHCNTAVIVEVPAKANTGDSRLPAGSRVASTT